MDSLLHLGPLPLDFLAKALLAIACGGLIGAEREMRHKPAGFRTNTLICLGSMVFMWLSIQVTVGAAPGQAADPGRIAAQVVVGIGFLGGGTIIQSRGRVTGLTSAAMIWVVSAVGMSIGGGYLAVGILTTAMILLVQFGLRLVERRVFGRCVLYDCQISFVDERGRTRRAIDHVLRTAGRGSETYDLRKADDHYLLTLQYCDVHPQHKKLLTDLWRIDGVREVRTLR